MNPINPTNSSNPKVIIRLYKEMDQKAWDAYIHAHSQGTIFHLTKWKNVIEKTYGHMSYYLMAVNSSKLKAISNGKQASTNNQQ